MKAELQLFWNSTKLLTPLEVIYCKLACSIWSCFFTATAKQVLWTELLAAPVQMRGSVSAQSPWDVMVDLFFYREPEEAKEEGEAPEPFRQEPFGQAQLPGAHGKPQS